MLKQNAPIQGKMPYLQGTSKIQLLATVSFFNLYKENEVIDKLTIQSSEKSKRPQISI